MPHFAPQIFLAPERYQFLAFGGSGFAPVSGWALAGYELCTAAAHLRSALPAVTLHLASSRRGWLGASGTADTWFAFLGCNSISPWSSNYNNYGKG